MNLWNLGDVATLLSSDFCVRLTQSLLHFLWQGLAIGAAVWIGDRLLRSASSQSRYAIGTAGLLVMLACVPLTYVVLGHVPANVPDAAATRESMNVADEPAASGVAIGPTPVLSRDASVASFRHTGDMELAHAAAVSAKESDASTSRLLNSLPALIAPYATLAYLLGVAIMLARLGLALHSGHRLRQSAAPLADPAILEMASRQARRIGLQVVPAIAWCQRAAVPLVVGIVRPMILLPTAIASGVAPDQLESLLAHELAHLKRLDLAVNLVQRLAESLLFFHPAVWFVSRRISVERENCCDDCVLAAGWGRVEYADALVRMAEVCGAVRGLTGVEGAGLLAASGEGPSQFKRRVLRLLDAEDHLRMGMSRGWLLAAAGVVLSALAAIPFLAERNADALAGQMEQAQPAVDKTPAPENPHRAGDAGDPFEISFRDAPWAEVLQWYGGVMKQSVDVRVVPAGNFTYDSPRPLNQREIILLINREVLRRGHCLIERNGSLTVETADVIARQYAETLRKEFMHGHELRKGPDAFDAYFEIVECRAVGETKSPAPEGPAIAYVLKARRDFTAAQLTDFLSACFGTLSVPSLKTGQPILADGFATRQGGQWLGTSAQALKAGEKIEVWQNNFQEWNARPPADYRIVIEGLVIGPEGNPLPAAHVRQLLLEEGTEFPGWAFGGEAVVDRQGKFQVSLQHATQFVSKVYLWASAPGHAPQRVGPIAVGFGKPAVPLTIELKPGFAGRLRLVLPSGGAIDKGEVEIATQDDLWAPGIPLGTLPITGEAIAVADCPPGPLQLKVRVPGFEEQQVRDVRPASGEVTEVQVPLVPKEKRFFRGKDARDRIERAKPAWSETHLDVQFGVAITGDKTKFRSGERVPLEMFVRNVGKEGVEITLSAEFLGNVPEVKNAAGEAIPVERILLLGSVALYREFLKPGEAFGFRHLGLGLGPNPMPGKRNWHPFWAEPKPGKYTLTHTHEIDVEPSNGLIPGKRVKFTSGVVEFEIFDGAASERQPPRDDANRSLQVARLKRQEYLEATFPNDERQLKGELSAAEQALIKSQASLESSKRLAAKGLITEIQVQTAEAAAKQAQIQLDLAQSKLDVLRKFTKEKVLRELDRKVVDALDALLDRRVALHVTDKPLIFVLDELEKAHHVPVAIDLKAIHARGLSEQIRVTIDVTDSPLRDIFKAALATAGLDFEVNEQGIRVPAQAKPAAALAPAQDGASIEIRYNIPGAEERVRFVVEGPNGSIGPEIVGSLKVNYVNNGRSLKIGELPSGDYQVTRYRTLMLEEALGLTRFLDRQQVALQRGESKSLEFTRPGGKRASGKIVGLEGKGINKVLVNICAASADSRESLRELETTIFDALLAKEDGSFTTEPLLPGKYTIVAEAYLPLTPQERVSTGDIEPRYVGVAKFTVPKAGEPEAVEVPLKDAQTNPDGAARQEEKWGDLDVQLVYDGPMPEPRTLPVPRDKAVFGTEVPDEALLVGDKGELANVAVYLTSAGIPIHPEARRRTEKPAELKVTGAGTRPRILPMMVPQKLKLINGTTVAANFKWDGMANPPFNVLVAREDSREMTLHKAERAPAPVADGIHPWLISYLLPLDHPYAAVSGTDGVAKLANLPEGEWTFRFWHEKVGYLKSAETGQREFKIKIKPGENRLKLRVSPEFSVSAAAESAEPASADQASSTAPEPDATVGKELKQAGVSIRSDQRGRITEIYLGALATDGILQRIAGLPALKTLHIETTRQLSPRGFEHLAAAPTLQSLGVYDVPLSQESVASVARIKSLQELSLGECGLSDGDLAPIGNLDGLKSLTLRGNAITDAGLDAVIKLTELEMLDLGNSSSVGSQMEITDAGLTRLTVLKRLKQLNLSSTRLPLGFTDKGLAHLSAFPDLQSLYVSGYDLGDESLVHIGRCANLRQLGLHFSSFTDAGMQEIRRLTKLKSISISSGRLTETGLLHLGELPELEFAELRTGGVTDRVLERLAGIKTLARLDLYASAQPGVAISLPPFTGRGLAHFKDHPALRTLWLTNMTIDASTLAALKGLTGLGELTLMMPSLSDDEVRSLQAALPKTRVSAAWGGHGIAPLQLENTLRKGVSAANSLND